MAENNLSQKLFKQKDGKKFAYADEIRKSIKKIQDKIDDMEKGWTRPNGTLEPEARAILEQIKQIIKEEVGEELNK